MFGATNELMALKVKNKTIPIRRLLPAWAPFLILLVACISTINPTFARTPYDGDRSVVIVAHSGSCDSSYRFGVQVADGLVINDGGLATVQGRVTPTGLVRTRLRARGSRVNGGFGPTAPCMATKYSPAAHST